MKFKKLLHDFLRTRASNDIEHQQVIVYLLHVVLIVVSVLMQFLGMGGSQQTLPLVASGLHLAVCIVAFALYLARRLTVPQAMTSEQRSWSASSRLTASIASTWWGRGS